MLRLRDDQWERIPRRAYPGQSPWPETDLHPSGLGRRALDSEYRRPMAVLAAVRRKVELHTSLPILTETARVLREKFNRSEQDITGALKMNSRVATIVRPVRKITHTQRCA
jgi:hypothetical protein